MQVMVRAGAQRSLLGFKLVLGRQVDEI